MVSALNLVVWVVIMVKLVKVFDGGYSGDYNGKYNYDGGCFDDGNTMKVLYLRSNCESASGVDGGSFVFENDDS